MSVKFLALSEASWERTLVYQKVFENFVVLNQQRKQDDVWHVYHHCLLPKLLIIAIDLSLSQKVVSAPTQWRRQAWITHVSSNTHLKTKYWRIQSQVRLRRT